MFKRRMEKEEKFAFIEDYRGQRSYCNYEDPIDLSAMSDSWASRLKGPRYGNKGRIENEERERYRRENLYYNCKKSRYRAKECNSQP